MKPRINKVGLKSVTVKQGQTITLEAPYAAEPLPTATWLRDTTVNRFLSTSSKHLSLSECIQELTADDRSQMTLTDKLAKLVIIKAVRGDTGRYTIRLVNSSGTETAECEVIVLGPPSKPRGPLEVKEVTKSSVTLSWSPPEDSGGKEISSVDNIRSRDLSTSRLFA